MARFVARRMLLIPVLLVLVNFLGFAYAHYARPLRAARTPFARAQAVEPLMPAYRAYLQSLAELDFSMQLDVPGNVRSNVAPSLGETLVRAAGASLGLMVLALASSVAFGFLLGLRAVQNEPPQVSRWLTLISTAGLAMPSFYIGSLFILASVFYVLWSGRGTRMPLPLEGFGWDEHLVFPILALMARPTVQLAQVTAGLLSEELGKQYVIAARSLGYTWRAIRGQYALRALVAPLALTVAGTLRLLVGELVLVEWLFKWPGIGRLLAWTLVPAQLSSSRGSPLFLNPQVMAAVLTLIAALFLVSDFAAAMLVRAFDPRLRNPEMEPANVG